MKTCLALLLVSISVVTSQMTFSDGWGVKRSSPLKPFQPNNIDNEGQQINNPMLDKCNTEYSQTLVQLHHKIMKLYDTYEQCQNRALGGLRPQRP